MDIERNYDPIEDTPEFKAVIEQVEKEVKEEVKGGQMGLGFCHYVWGVKKRILKEKYGIDWKTPAEMNPMTMFD